MQHTRLSQLPTPPLSPPLVPRPGPAQLGSGRLFGRVCRRAWAGEGATPRCRLPAAASPQRCGRQPGVTAPAPAPPRPHGVPGGRDRHQGAAVERRGAWARCSNPLLATAAAGAAGKRRGGRSTAELRGPARSPPLPAAAMGWEEKQVRGYPEFVQTAQRYHGRPIFALFCGDKDAEGRSWCPDCVTAEPVVRKELHNMPDESVFIYCLVGDRAYWKDPNNEFRKNLKLTGVPTLLKYGTPQKLVEEECFKADLVRMLFTED
ncbi:thioredoxin domain-containing protein 17 [Patagioenas fasciata]